MVTARHPQLPDPLRGNALILAGGFALWMVLLGAAWINGGFRDDAPPMKPQKIAIVKGDNLACVAGIEAAKRHEVEHYVERTLAILDGPHAKNPYRCLAKLQAAHLETMRQLNEEDCNAVEADT